jgi:hypothetical protein
MMATQGVYQCAEKIKHDLKEMFLHKEKQYYTDGSPVMLTLQHPESEKG